MASFREAVIPKTVPVEESNLTYTVKGALSHKSSKSARLDYFSRVMARDKKTATSDSEIERLTAAAWQESPLDTLRLMFHRRDPRGGAGERHASHVSFRWLARNHE